MDSKVLIIGWDGATWEYLDPLLAKGDLPNLASLLARGTRLTLKSTVPPYTNIAWPSLVTGSSPEKTGVFDAVHFLPASYQTIPANAIGYRGIPIWRWANQFGRTAGVINVPMTYPAQKLDGYLVSGFDSPKNSPKVAYPRKIIERWAEEGNAYKILAEEISLMDSQNPHHPRGDLESFTARWEALTHHQGEFSAWLMKNHPVDLFFTVFSGTDSINHRTRDFNRIARVYRAADKALGLILDPVDKDTLICLVSDHGSTPARRYISLNRILHQLGWLRFQPNVADQHLNRITSPLHTPIKRIWRRLPDSIKRIISWPFLKMDSRLVVGYENIDWPRTKLFARSSMGPLYVNLQGRFPEGCVSPSEYEPFLQEAVQTLREIRGPAGEAVFAQVNRWSERSVDSSPDDLLPDLVVEPANWSDHMISGFPSDPIIRPIPEEREYGTHTPDGVWVMAGPNIQVGGEALTGSIKDVVPTLLTAWGLPISDQMNSWVLQDIFTNPIEVQSLIVEIDEETETNMFTVAPEEILNRLRALGYLD